MTLSGNPLVHMFTRATAWLIALTFAQMTTVWAETIKALSGSEAVSGEIVGIMPNQMSLAVKIKQASGVELDLEMHQVEPQSQDKIFAWMGQAARMNGAKVPHLRFSASKQATNGPTFAQAPGSLSQLTHKITKNEHSLAVSNAGSALTSGLTMYRLAKHVKTVKSSYEGRSKGTSWVIDSEVIPSVQPKEVQKALFRPLTETSSRIVSPRNSRGSLSSAASEQEKIEIVYLMVFDGTGNLIYFSKV